MDNRPTPCVRHFRYGVFAGQDGTLEVYIHSPVPYRLFYFRYHARAGHGGIVKQNVQRPVPFQANLNHGPAVVFKADIDLKDGSLPPFCLNGCLRFFRPRQVQVHQ